MKLLFLAAFWSLAFSSASAFNREGHKIQSAMAAVYTPMKGVGGVSLDLDRIPAYAEYIAKLNISNIMPAGSNGESLSLSVPERKSLAEAWAKAAMATGLKLYMHIGSESLVESMELAKHAASTPGVTGIVHMTPVYFKPTVKTLYDFLAAVGKEAPELPFWFYHFPDDTGVLPGQAFRFLEYVDSKNNGSDFPNFMGIKFTDYNLMDFQLCTQVGFPKKYNMLYGRDEMALAAIILGADAAVSSTIQYSNTLRQTLNLYAKGDMAGAKAAQMENAKLCSNFGPYSAKAQNVQKNIMQLVGMGVGPSRWPWTDLSKSEKEELLERIKLWIDHPAKSSNAVMI